MFHHNFSNNLLSKFVILFYYIQTVLNDFQVKLIASNVVQHHIRWIFYIHLCHVDWLIFLWFTSAVTNNPLFMLCLNCINNASADVKISNFVLWMNAMRSWDWFHCLWKNSKILMKIDLCGKKVHFGIRIKDLVTSAAQRSIDNIKWWKCFSSWEH